MIRKLNFDMEIKKPTEANSVGLGQPRGEDEQLWIIPNRKTQAVARETPNTIHEIRNSPSHCECNDIDGVFLGFVFHQPTAESVRISSMGDATFISLGNHPSRHDIPAFPVLFGQTGLTWQACLMIIKQGLIAIKVRYL